MTYERQAKTFKFKVIPTAITAVGFIDGNLVLESEAMQQVLNRTLLSPNISRVRD